MLQPQPPEAQHTESITSEIIIPVGEMITDLQLPAEGDSIRIDAPTNSGSQSNHFADLLED